MSRDLGDLLDRVDSVPGWRVDKIDGSRWRVYPPPPAPLIHVSASDDPHAFKNTLAMLRRAGFRDKEDTRVPQVGKGGPAQVPDRVVVQLSPMDQIRADVDMMLGCLTRISDNLQSIDKEREGIQQLKTLLGTVLK